ncbi:MAG: LacI family DNA-binding transcriptional regulator [Bowdeniella nasicola]|nr:LacI family DNA-binding transcriptional regulator [Bowdeniella nasicola]
MTKRPTQKDVARVAGTSTAVVSYVLNDGPRPISEEARRRVMAAIAETGYRPNGVARALAHGQSSVFGLVVPDIANPFLAQLTQALEREFLKRGYSLLIGDSEDDPEREIKVIETLISQQITGLVWYGVEEPLPLEVVDSAILPVVLIGTPTGLASPRSGGRFICVNTNDKEHATLATAHLIGHGRTRIAHLGGPTGKLNAHERAQGWLDGLRAAGLPSGQRYTAPFTREGGYDSVHEILDAGCDAIVVSNEMQAVGLLAGLSRAGINVPEEIAVIALNGTPAAQYTVPSLSTVHPLMDGLSKSIADALDPKSAVSLIQAEGRLTPRASCGCADTPEGEQR